MSQPEDAYWSHVAARLAALAAAERAAANAIAPFILDHLAVAERGRLIPDHVPPERGAELAAAYGRMIEQQDRAASATDALHPGRRKSRNR